MSINATFAAAAAAATSSHSLTGAELYAQAGTDFSKLSWMEQQWAAWYIMIGNPVIATGLFAFVFHEVRQALFFGRVSNASHMRAHALFVQLVYFGRCVPWIIIDAIPYFRQWKLQPMKVPTPEEQWECTKVVLFSHFTVEAPAVSVTIIVPVCTCSF